MASMILTAVFVLETKGRTNAEGSDLGLLGPSDTMELAPHGARQEGEEGIYSRVRKVLIPPEYLE